jgi:hypothetical protein
MTATPESPQVTLTLEAFSEPISGSYETSCGRTGDFAVCSSSSGLERLCSEAIADHDEEAGTQRAAIDVVLLRKTRRENDQ